MARSRSRYARYDGGPDPLAPPVDLAEALDAIGEDVMAGYSPERAMREFLRRGGRDQQGLDDLARRVAEQRRELLQRHHLDGTMEEVRELLDRALLEERKQLARDVDMDDGDRAFRELQLENLPSSTAAAVSELGEDAVLLLDLRRRRVGSGSAAGGTPGRARHRIRAGAHRQGIEFDYCAVQAADTLRRAGWSAVMINSNPETVSTDFDASTRLYFEPLDPESVRKVIDAETPGGGDLLPAVVAYGGQTPLNLAAPLAAAACRCSASTWTRSTRRRSGRASRRWSTASASRSRKAGWPTALRKP